MVNQSRVAAANASLVLAAAALALGLLLPGAAAADQHPNPPAGTCAPYTPLDPANFGQSARIDNTFFPLPPATQYVLEGRINTAGVTRSHRVTFTVTDLVKKIDGVDNLVIHDVDINNGVKSEAELSFFAQDKQGTVWNFGEYPEQFGRGSQFLGAPKTWISGQNALPGVHMAANPQLGTARYLQAYAPDVQFLDCAQVFAKGQATCVPLACYQDVLVTDETSPLAEANAHQRKYHAPGVGIVQVGAVDDPEGEILVLVQRTRLSPEALAVVRDDSLKMEQRAYQINTAYQQTSPAVRCQVEVCGEVTYGTSTGDAAALAGQVVVLTHTRPRPPFLEVTNPRPGDMLTPGAMVIHGMALDDNAETGLGVDRVSLFLGDRDDDNGAVFLGDATLGLASPVGFPREECVSAPSPACPAGVARGDPQFALAGWSLKTPALKKAAHAVIHVYAHSSVSGVEAVKVIPVSVGPPDEEGGEE